MFHKQFFVSHPCGLNRLLHSKDLRGRFLRRFGHAAEGLAVSKAVPVTFDRANKCDRRISLGRIQPQVRGGGHSLQGFTSEGHNPTCWLAASLHPQEVPIGLLHSARSDALNRSLPRADCTNYDGTVLLVPRRREITAIPREHQSRSGFLALLVGLPERRKCLGMPAMRVYRTLPPRLSLAPHCQVLLPVANGFAAQWLRTAPALTLRDVLLLPDQRSAIMSLASFRWWKFPPQEARARHRASL